VYHAPLVQEETTDVGALRSVDQERAGKPSVPKANPDAHVTRTCTGSLSERERETRGYDPYIALCMEVCKAMGL